MFHGAANHYHFHTVPGVVPDAKAFMHFSQSPAAQGEGEEGGTSKGRRLSGLGLTPVLPLLLLLSPLLLRQQAFV